MKSKAVAFTGWTIVWALILYFIYMNALRYFNPGFTVYTPDFSPYAPYLIIHITGGIAALLIGPFQLSTSLRKQYNQLHKNLGKLYLIAVLISGLSGAYLSIFDNILRKQEFTFGTGVFGLAMAWLITSGMAYYAIRNRNINQHKEWMIRSYVVTFGFVFFRIIYEFLYGIEAFPFKNDIGGVSAWACWSLPLLFTEWVLQANKIKRN